MNLKFGKSNKGYTGEGNFNTDSLSSGKSNKGSNGSNSVETEKTWTIKSNEGERKVCLLHNVCVFSCERESKRGRSFVL